MEKTEDRRGCKFIFKAKCDVDEDASECNEKTDGGLCAHAV